MSERSLLSAGSHKYVVMIQLERIRMMVYSPTENSGPLYTPRVLRIQKYIHVSHILLSIGRPGPELQQRLFLGLED